MLLWRSYAIDKSTVRNLSAIALIDAAARDQSFVI